MSKALNKWIYHDVEASTRAMNREIQKALRIHKLLGNPVCIAGENGEVITIQPEDIVINDELLGEDQG